MVIGNFQCDVTDHLPNYFMLINHSKLPKKEQSFECILNLKKYRSNHKSRMAGYIFCYRYRHCVRQFRWFWQKQISIFNGKSIVAKQIYM